MLVLIIVVLSLLALAFYTGKYVIRPYLRMLRYVQYKGASWVPFFPLLGAFKHAEESYNMTGD